MPHPNPLHPSSLDLELYSLCAMHDDDTTAGILLAVSKSEDSEPDPMIVGENPAAFLHANIHESSVPSCSWWIPEGGVVACRENPETFFSMSDLLWLKSMQTCEDENGPLPDLELWFPAPKEVVKMVQSDKPVYPEPWCRMVTRLTSMKNEDWTDDDAKFAGVLKLLFVFAAQSLYGPECLEKILATKERLVFVMSGDEKHKLVGLTEVEKRILVPAARFSMSNREAWIYVDRFCNTKLFRQVLPKSGAAMYVDALLTEALKHSYLALGDRKEMFTTLEHLEAYLFIPHLVLSPSQHGHYIRTFYRLQAAFKTVFTPDTKGFDCGLDLSLLPYLQARTQDILMHDEAWPTKLAQQGLYLAPFVRLGLCADEERIYFRNSGLAELHDVMLALDNVCYVEIDVPPQPIEPWDQNDVVSLPVADSTFAYVILMNKFFHAQKPDLINELVQRAVAAIEKARSCLVLNWVAGVTPACSGDDDQSSNVTAIEKGSFAPSGVTPACSGDDDKN